MKKILLAASLLALTLSSNTTYAKEVLFSCNNEFSNRNFVAVEGTDTTPPSASCPEASGHCKITVTVFSDFSGTIDFEAMVIPFTDTNPSGPKTQAILDNVTSIILSGGNVPINYQP